MKIAAEQSLARFLEAPTRFLFFTGKGGVGKIFSKRTALVPWVTEDPTSPERLQQLFQTATVSRYADLRL